MKRFNFLALLAVSFMSINAFAGQVETQEDADLTVVINAQVEESFRVIVSEADLEGTEKTGVIDLTKGGHRLDALKSFEGTLGCKDKAGALLSYAGGITCNISGADPGVGKAQFAIPLRYDIELSGPNQIRLVPTSTGPEANMAAFTNKSVLIDGLAENTGKHGASGEIKWVGDLEFANGVDFSDVVVISVALEDAQ